MTPEGELLMELLEEIDFNPGCEHAFHDTDPGAHDGPATHYAVYRGTCCKESKGRTRLVCAPYAGLVLSGALLTCRLCERKLPGLEILEIRKLP